MGKKHRQLSISSGATVNAPDRHALAAHMAAAREQFVINCQGNITRAASFQDFCDS